jgi:hypothetical protein
MSDLNLLPSEAKFQAERMHLKKLINNSMWLLGGGWLIGVIILLGLNLLGQINLNQLQKKYQRSIDQYKSLAGDVLINQKVKNQAKVVATVLQSRFEYVNSMDKIRNIFTDKVIIDSFDLDETKVYKIEAFVPEGKDLDEVETRIDDINQGRVEGFKSAKLEVLELDNIKGWSFSMEVVLL